MSFLAKAFGLLQSMISYSSGSASSESVNAPLTLATVGFAIAPTSCASSLKPFLVRGYHSTFFFFSSSKLSYTSVRLAVLGVTPIV